MNHFYIDMETMDTESSAVVLSMAILHVPDSIPDGMLLTENNFRKIMAYGKYWKLDRKPQVQFNRTINKSTVNYWMEQKESAKDLLSETGCVHPMKALMEFNQYLIDHKFDIKTSVIWSRRMIDSAWYLSMCRTFNITPVAPLWSFRDTATALELATGNVNGVSQIRNADTPYIDKHNCLCNAVLDYFRASNLEDNSYSENIPTDYPF